jgi:cell shape-determining protein MreC
VMSKLKMFSQIGKTYQALIDVQVERNHLKEQNRRLKELLREMFAKLDKGQAWCSKEWVERAKELLKEDV